jgi:cytoskeletal protein CcmA (bactofilin family)
MIFGDDEESFVSTSKCLAACTAAAERVVVDGKVDGPIREGEVLLKSQAHVVGDIHHQSLSIESGAFFDGHSVRVRGNGQPPEKLESKRQVANTQESLSRCIERAESVEAD